MNTYAPPVISVSYDLDSDEYLLMADGLGGPAIAGERLLRAEPWPNVRFRHSSQDAAERDAATLRVYLGECASGKRSDKEHAPTRRGWWMD